MVCEGWMESGGDKRIEKAEEREWKKRLVMVTGRKMEKSERTDRKGKEEVQGSTGKAREISGVSEKQERVCDDGADGGNGGNQVGTKGDGRRQAVL